MTPSTPAPSHAASFPEELSKLHGRLSRALEGCVVIDTETTGLVPESDRIVEIALLQVRGGEVRRRFHSLINPLRPIPRECAAIHGLTDEDVRYSPSFADLLPQIRALIGSDALVGHNVAFDAEFLALEGLRACGHQRETKEHGTKERRAADSPSTVCTAAAARLLIPRESVGRYTLANVARHLGLQVRDSHRASADAELTLGVLQRLESLCTAKRGFE